MFFEQIVKNSYNRRRAYNATSIRAKNRDKRNKKRQ